MDQTITLNGSGKRLTKREKRILRQQGLLDNEKFISNMKLKEIIAYTDSQQAVFDAWDSGHNLLLHGMAGTGKSFLSLYLALDELFNSGKHVYNKVVVVRSAVPTRDMGFMPGSAKEKAKLYEAPYNSICCELFGRGDAYDILKTKEIISFETTSYVRGLTINDAIIIVDEIANLTFHELDSIITRVGKNCRIIFCGDMNQSDFTKEAERNGLPKFMKIISNMKKFKKIEFGIGDIVRSDLVKEYLVTKHKLSITA